MSIQTQEDHIGHTLWRIEDPTEMVFRRKKRRFGGRKQKK